MEGAVPCAAISCCVGPLARSHVGACSTGARSQRRPGDVQRIGLATYPPDRTWCRRAPPARSPCQKTWPCAARPPRPRRVRHRARACVCASHARACANRAHARGTPMHRQVAALSGGRRIWHVDLARVGLAADIVGAGAKAVLPHVPLGPEIAEQHSHRVPRAARPHAVPVRASSTQCTQCTQTDNAHATMRVAFSPARGPPWDHGAHNEAALNRGESVCLAAGWCAAAAYTPPTYIRICGASASWARCAEPLASSPPVTIMTLCPSGLRGWTQVQLAQAAWVQIPQVSVNCFRGAVHARMAGARQRPHRRPQQ